MTLVRYQFRRDTAATWTTNNPVLTAGEAGFETDTGLLKIGDGTTAWTSLPYIGDVAALTAEIVAARGSRSNLNDRISTISNFASPNAGGVIVGQYYDNAFQGTASTTIVGAANRLDMAPFYTSQPLRIDQIGVAVSTASAGQTMKCFIYGSSSLGWPEELLYEADTDLDVGTTGFKFHTLDFTFDSGRQYWLGVRYSGAGTIRAINTSSAVNLGVNGSGGSNYFTVLRRTLAYATALPNPWVFATSDRAANIGPPSIRMRAAAL